MIRSKIYRQLKQNLPHHVVRRQRGLGIQTFTFEPREGHRKIHYVLTEYRGSLVLGNLNTGLEKSYRADQQEDLLCMLRQVQDRQRKKSYDGSGHGNAKSVRLFWNRLVLCCTRILPVRLNTRSIA
uniref:Uncharacterized protein n=1 Tax=Myoviridae sp. ctshb19 TaxID=2825194 RepID=A0A8S5UG95_9CAUD|nr:MAG TPA: hypothetical protein [Myoviridae sp. ctshb19]